MAIAIALTVGRALISTEGLRLLAGEPNPSTDEVVCRQSPDQHGGIATLEDAVEAFAGRGVGRQSPDQHGGIATLLEPSLARMVCSSAEP